LGSVPEITLIGTINTYFIILWERGAGKLNKRIQAPPEEKNSHKKVFLSNLVLILFLFALISVFPGGVYAQDFNDYKNCTKCHNKTASAGYAKINETALNISIHRDLNNDSSLTLPAGAPNVTKACWACHGNGTEPGGSTPGEHDGWPNLKNPWNCSDCHTNKTGGYNSTTGRGNYSAPLVLQHLNGTDGSYYNALTFNITINTTVQCESCHNNSVGYSNDIAGSPENNTNRSDVSHYGNNQSIKPGGYNSTNCTVCHRNTAIGRQWSLPQALPYINYTIRHGDDNATFCGKCHNSTSADNLHAEKLFKPFYTHQRYDWEDDDDNEDKNGVNKGQRFKQESCYACHNETQVTDLYPSKNCEDCHLNNSVGPYNSLPEV
jgi:hypothetical protein